MALNFRRGSDALNAPDNSGKRLGGAFCKEIRWSGDNEAKYIGFINPLAYVAGVDLHEWVPVGSGVSKSGKPFTKYEWFIDRRDPSIGESHDDLTDRLEHQPKHRILAAAVELEPVTEKVNGRDKPVGFTVKTETFTRKNEEGEEEEVTAPVVGIITQAKQNFFGYLESFDEVNGPIEEAIFQVIRRGKGADTMYDFFPYQGLEIDYTNLIENKEGISYIKGILGEIVSKNEPEPFEEALSIGAAYLDKRLSELADKDRYDTLVSHIDHIENKFGTTSKKKSQTSSSDDMIPVQKESKMQRVRRQYAAA